MPVTIDRARYQVALQFLRGLMAGYEMPPGDHGEVSLFCETRALLPKGVKGQPIVRTYFPLCTEGLSNAAASSIMLSECRDVYMGVYPRYGRLGNSDAVVQAHFLYAEWDGKAEWDEKMLRGLPVPQMVVSSGGGIHAYWRLERPVMLPTRESRKSFSGLLKRIVCHVGADVAVRDVARILRVPGTYNHKYDPPRSVQLLPISGDVIYPLSEWERIFPEPTHKKVAYYDTAPYTGDLPKWLLEDLARAARPGEWNSKTLRMAAYMAEKGVPRHESHDMLHKHMVLSGKADPQHERELERILDWADARCKN